MQHFSAEVKTVGVFNSLKFNPKLTTEDKISEYGKMVTFDILSPYR